MRRDRERAQDAALRVRAMLDVCGSMLLADAVAALQEAAKGDKLRLTRGDACDAVKLAVQCSQASFRIVPGGKVRVSR